MESRAQEEEDRRRMLEDVQSDKATISRALTQNRTLKDQLAELQNGFVKVVRLPVQLSFQHIHKVLLSVYSLFFCDFFSQITVNGLHVSFYLHPRILLILFSYLTVVHIFQRLQLFKLKSLYLYRVMRTWS